MKTTRTALLAAAAALLFSVLPASAGLFSSEKDDLLEQADADFAAAGKAAAESRPLDQYDLLGKAATAYQRLLSEDPDFKRAHVSSRYTQSIQGLEDLRAKIARGEVKIPSPDEILAGAGNGYVANPEDGDTRPQGKPGVGTDRIPLPALVETESGAPAPAAPGTAPAASGPVDERLRSAIPNPRFARKDGAPPRPAPPAASPMAVASVPPQDARRTELFLPMIQGTQAAEAMMLLEDVVEAEGASASVPTRLLFVRALLQCGGEPNAKRADEVLAGLPDSVASDPAVRGLRTAAAIARGDFMEALLQTHQLLEENPDFSDGYVNLAYVLMLQDPNANRDQAARTYKLALERGARRDVALERGLGLRIAR